MKIQRDLKEFIELMNSNGVEYVVVDGHPVAYHDYPRFTGDMNFFEGLRPKTGRGLLRFSGRLCLWIRPTSIVVVRAPQRNFRSLTR